MNEIMIMSVIKNALVIGTFVSAPILIGSLLVGLIISIFQATTQIQEQTLTFVPKLVVIMLVIALGGSWMLNKLVVFTSEMFMMIPGITR